MGRPGSLPPPPPPAPQKEPSGQGLVSSRPDSSDYTPPAPAPQVSCSFNSSCWTLRPYDDPLFEPTSFRLGAPIALFHAEIEAFLSADAYNDGDGDDADFTSPAIIFREGQDRLGPPHRKDDPLDLNIPMLSPKQLSVGRFARRRPTHI